MMRTTVGTSIARPASHINSIKKVLCLFLSLVMLISFTASVDLYAYADTYSGNCGDNVAWELDTDTGVLTISGNGNMPDYRLSDCAPWNDLCSKIKTVDIKYGVTSIGDCAFWCCESLTSITIPESVISIGSSAFYCTSLTSIAIPESVTNVGDSAFSCCESLTSITIPESLTCIGFGVFDYCSSLTSVTIPESVTSIGEYAFSNCKSLASITIPDNVTSIGNYAFSYCDSLTSVTILNSLTSIGVNVFYYCTSLESINVDSENKSFSSEDGILFNKSKTEIICYPEGKSSSSYTIPDGVTRINDYAISNCDSLTSVIIPNSVTSIGEYAFSLCDSLTSITIPDGITSIGNYAFLNCESLENIAIPSSLTRIGAYVFYSCSSLTSITIPDSVTSIGSDAFEFCENLTSIIVPDSVTSIGDSAFRGCESLKDVYYSGTIGQWKKIVIDSYNEDLTKATIHCTNGIFDENEQEHTHSFVTKVTQPTCTKQGYTTYTCDCGYTYTETIAKKVHTYKKYTTKATTSKNGSVVTKCTACGEVKSKLTIYYPKTIKLSTTTYIYNGKTKTPSVTVKDSKGKTLKKNTDYTVAYAKGRKYVGKYSVKITFKGNYSGSKTLYFTIIPKATALSSVTAKSKGFTVKWKKQTSQTTGYQIQYSTSSKFKSAKTVTVSKNKTTAKTISKLKAKKKYYVRVRTYKTVKINGKSTKIYSSWSKSKSVTTKK